VLEDLRIVVHEVGAVLLRLPGEVFRELQLEKTRLSFQDVSRHLKLVAADVESEDLGKGLGCDIGRR
jgi:hypothetical protein